jgi:hypothetical protein
MGTSKEIMPQKKGYQPVKDRPLKVLKKWMKAANDIGDPRKVKRREERKDETTQFYIEIFSGRVIPGGIYSRAKCMV